MASTACIEAVQMARNYYNSDDADRFYATIWGGEDIHIGLYETPDESIGAASRRTVEHMAKRCVVLRAPCRVLDLGSGYGGSARYLAQRYGARVTGLNLSEVENARARAKNRAASLDALVDIIDGSFESLPFDNESFDLVWSQDAILHSGDREEVLREATRVLRPGGELVFTDPMQCDEHTQDASALEPILARIHLSTLGSPAFYERVAARLGLLKIDFEELTEHLVTHYGRVLAETEFREAELLTLVDAAYVQRMKTGLLHWINGGRSNLLTWGVFHFRKPAATQ